MSITIQQQAPDHPDSVQLIDELEAILAPHYPDESRHGYDVAKLVREGVDFFVVNVEGKLAGCGGIQFYGDDYGELKRMYIRPDFRGLGLSKRIIEHLEAHSRSRGIMTLRLETGIYQTAAIGLYERMGFQRIEPFGDYVADPLSVYFEKRLG